MYINQTPRPTGAHGGPAGTPIGGGASSPDALSPMVSHPAAAHTDLSNSNDLFSDAQGELDAAPTGGAQVQDGGAGLGESSNEIRV